jgi:hypothetical protein
MNYFAIRKMLRKNSQGNHRKDILYTYEIYIYIYIYIYDLLQKNKIIIIKRGYYIHR